MAARAAGTEAAGVGLAVDAEAVEAAAGDVVAGGALVVVDRKGTPSPWAPPSAAEEPHPAVIVAITRSAAARIGRPMASTV
jgi:hypothetical protein